MIHNSACRERKHVLFLASRDNGDGSGGGEGGFEDVVARNPQEQTFENLHVCQRSVFVEELTLMFARITRVAKPTSGAMY